MSKSTPEAALKTLQKQFDEFKAKTRAYLLSNSRIGDTRDLMTISPANEKGMINGITIPELVMLVNLSDSNNESIQLRTADTADGYKNLVVIARKRPQPVPLELL